MLLLNTSVRMMAAPLMMADRMLLSLNVVFFCRDIISSRRGCRNVPGDGVSAGVGATVALYGDTADVGCDGIIDWEDPDCCW